MMSIDELYTVNGCTCIGKFGCMRVLRTAIDKVTTVAPFLVPAVVLARELQASKPAPIKLPFLVNTSSLSSFHYTIPNHLFVHLSHHCLGNFYPFFCFHIFTPVLRKLDAEALSETVHWRLGMATRLHVKAQG